MGAEGAGAAGGAEGSQGGAGTPEGVRGVPEGVTPRHPPHPHLHHL